MISTVVYFSIKYLFSKFSKNVLLSSIIIITISQKKLLQESLKNHFQNHFKNILYFSTDKPL